MTVSRQLGKISMLALLWAVLCSFIGPKEYKYDVKETRITREEFLEAYYHSSEYIYVKDTAVSPIEEKRVIEAVFGILTEKDKERYASGELEICDIRRYSTGEYAACLSEFFWHSRAVFLNDKFEPDSTYIEGDEYDVYTTSGIFAALEGFDSDFHALIHFYARNGEESGRMQEIAFYKNTTWMLEWLVDFPEYEGIEERMVWYKGAMYCAGLEFCKDANGNWEPKPIFIKLELVKKGYIDVKPYVETALNDFVNRKDAALSNVFYILIQKHKIDNLDVLELSVLPEDEHWKFLLSNCDSLGTHCVSIDYVERDYKLFYWDVDGANLTQEVYNVLLKYDFIERRDVPNQEWLIGERGYFQDGVKNQQYYFCKSDPKHFKRRYSSASKLPKRMKCRK